MPRRRRGRHGIGAEVEPYQVDETAEIEDEDRDEEFDQAPERPRRRALRRRRRRRALGRVGIATIVGAVAVAGLLALPYYAARERHAEDERANKNAITAGQRPITTLVFGTHERDAPDEQEAMWLMLFFYDPKDREGTAVHIPAHTAAEIPGRGLNGLNGAYASGGIPLLLVSVENLLGIQIDRYLELSDKDARVLFQETGPISVDIPEDVRVPAGKSKARLWFVAGQRELSARELVRLLYIRGLDTDDIDFGSRQLAFWDGVFEKFDNDPQSLARAITESAAALAESDATPRQLAVFFAGLTDLPRVSFTLTSLPVRAVAAGVDELYGTDATEIKEFVSATFDDSRPPGDEIRVQILNGNGVPGIGQEVAQRLVGQGFRVILSGNARSLDYKETLIVTYDPTDRGQALADRAKEILGVGEVQVSVQQQGIVDLTIVIGKDFLQTL